MNGIENITDRILSDARSEADRMTAEARARTQELTKQAEVRIEQETREILERGKAVARERRERIESAARMEGDRLLLACRQEMLNRAFERALEKLCTLPEEKYVDLLARLCAEAAITGREEIVLSPADRKKVGAQVTSRANALLSDGQLTLSQETRSIRGGVILVGEGVETNCAFDTLIRLVRPEVERQVAKLLFDE